MDPKEIRKRLGLAEDASDDQVQTTLRELNVATGIEVKQNIPAADAPPAAAAPTESITPTAPVAPTAVEAAADAIAKLPEGMVAIDKGTLDVLVAASRTTTDFVTKQQKSGREAVVAAAMADGRIPPVSRDHWLKTLEVDPNGEATLASLTPGLIPVELRGTAPANAGGEGGPEISDEIVAGWTDGLFPEVRNQRVAAAAAEESGLSGRRSRIMADSSYARR